MTLQYCSDLHLEFRRNRDFLAKNPIQPVGDLLVLAGDIVPFAIMDRHARFFDYLSDHFKTVYWMPGNHEYYGSDAEKRSGVVHETIRENVFLVNNVSINLRSVRLIFSTLWSKIQPPNQLYVESSLSDFRAIAYGGRPISAPVYNQLHLESLAFLTGKLRIPYAGQTIVVSHHVPTAMHYLIDTSAIDHWIYGHHHQNVPDFCVGKTEMHTNQLGYVEYWEHEQFRGDKVIALNASL
jgi:predicted phosphohydrolase